MHSHTLEIRLQFLEDTTHQRVVNDKRTSVSGILMQPFDLSAAALKFKDGQRTADEQHEKILLPALNLVQYCGMQGFGKISQYEIG